MVEFQFLLKEYLYGIFRARLSVRKLTKPQKRKHGFTSTVSLCSGPSYLPTPVGPTPAPIPRPSYLPPSPTPRPPPPPPRPTPTYAPAPVGDAYAVGSSTRTGTVLAPPQPSEISEQLTADEEEFIEYYI